MILSETVFRNNSYISVIGTLKIIKPVGNNTHMLMLAMSSVLGFLQSARGAKSTILPVLSKKVTCKIVDFASKTELDIRLRSYARHMRSRYRQAKPNITK